MPKFKFLRLKSPLANPMSKAGQILFIRNAIKNGLIAADSIAFELATKGQKDMEKQVTKARKKGRAITEDNLVREIEKTPEFLEFCEELGLSIEYWRDMARRVIGESNE